MSATPSPTPPPVAVQEELGTVPPGALLSSMLEDVDIERVCGHDTVVMLGAEYRQLCRQQARVYRALLETGLRKPFSIDTVERMSRPDEFAAEEARAVLVWSRTRAERAFGFAVDLFMRLPLLGEAMLAGNLDEPRARAFVDWTSGLTDAQAEQVCEQLLSESAQLMVGELIDRIKRACLAIDPDYAEKRYRDALRTRLVRGSRNPDGTANLGGYNQPLDRIAAASEHIDALARACKRAGDKRPIDYIRSDLFLGLADGTFERMSHDEIIAYVLAHPYSEPDDDKPGGNPGGSKPDSDGRPGGDGKPDSDGRPGGDGKPGSDGRPGGDGKPGSDRNDGGLGATDGGRPGSGEDSADRSNAEKPGGGPSDGEPGGSSHPASGSMPACGGDGRSGQESNSRSDNGGDVSAHDSSCGDGDQSNTRNGPAAPAGRPRAVPEVRVELATVLGENDRPGEIPPWGPIPAALARDLVARMGSAEWRYVLCGRDDRAITGGLLRTRVRTSSTERLRRDAHRGGIVEIAVSVAELGRLATRTATQGPWAPVLAELASYVGQAPRIQDADGDDPLRRTPGAALRRWVQQRDRQCPHPSCRAPARASDQDHRIRFSDGGPTDGANLSPPCRHDHRLKDEGHWVTTQPEPGLTVWTSPLGHQYQSRPPPIMVTLPEPYQDPDNRWDFPTGRYEYSGRPIGCDCDEPCAGGCDGRRLILPPPPTRVPDDERADDPEPTRIFDPDDSAPF
ncbi:MAG TPA: DUF222 domain-containing protein [Jiangellaceae bacterium]